MDEQRAIKIVIEALGNTRLRDGIEPRISTDLHGLAFRVTLEWEGWPTSTYIVSRDGTVAHVLDAPKSRPAR